MKMQVYPSDVASFPPLYEKKSFITYIKFYMRENDVSQSNVKEMKFDVIKQIKITSRLYVQ